jgi:DNA polymerase III epsilon subunit-like protein
MSAKFDKLLAIDCETSGFTKNCHNPAQDHQMVSLALIVANTNFEPIEEFYIEIKWDGKSEWSSKAESIHKLSKEYLDQHGVDEAVAAEKAAQFIYKHFGANTPLTFLGHNLVGFDIPFLRDFLQRHDLNFKIAQRHIDTFSLAMPTLGTYTSDSLFSTLGFKNREAHNALEDAKMALESVKIISDIWKSTVYGAGHEVQKGSI